MTFRTILFLSAILAGQFCFGQESTITTENVSKLFKSSIRQSSKSKIEADSNPWLICNSDSSFFKSDTLLLIQNNPNHNFVRKKCCAFIGWTFYKNNKFVLSDINYCSEPPTSKVTTINDFYSIKVAKINTTTVIETYRNNMLIDSFIVLGYKTFNDSIANEDVGVLKLVRRNKSGD
jgi:hypothetical protein